MINHLQLIRNVGRFDSVTTAANIALGRLTLIYAENGRGKTTLAAILRSLATGDAIPIVERRRLALPNASFIGFTGTPIEQNDANARAVFGEYVPVYDIPQAVIDKAMPLREAELLCADWFESSD